MGIESVLGLLANVAEIIAGLAIVFSIVKVWPAFSNLNKIARKPKDWSEEFTFMQQALEQYWSKSIDNLDDALDAILYTVLVSRGSDLHLEIKEIDDELFGSVRCRRDGAMHEVCRFDALMYDDLVAVIRERIGGADTNEGRIPFFLEEYDKPVEFRVGIMPAMSGDVVTMRVLDRQSAKMPFDVLGIQEYDMANLQAALNANSGLMIFGGPTGSGKTVSLYTSLNSLDHQKRKIVTIEDPVEVELPTITQIQVQDEPGRRFPDVFSGVMRSDPDVLLISEIRGEVTAHACLRAAGTGHLVLTTIHANSAVLGLESLKRFGDDLDNVDIFIMNQRLAKLLCRNCSEPRTLSSDEVNYIEDICRANRRDPGELRQKYRRPVGCDQCQDGYIGRVGGYETLRVTPEILALQNREDVFEAAIAQGMTSITFNLLDRASRGHTSLEEVRRVADDYLV